MAERNETNQLWRDVKADARRKRDHIETKREVQLTKLVVTGTIDARQPSEYHWKIWLVGRPDIVADYWPRTGTIVSPRGKGRGGPKRVVAILKGVDE